MGMHIVDSNFFIQAHRNTYPFDVVPSFWIKIKELAHAGKIISIDKVKHEINSGADLLKDWCIANLPVDFFKDTSSLLSEYATVTSWAQNRNPPFAPAAITEFLDADEADAWLLSHALNDVQNRIIVTHEVPAPLILKKVKIPDVCAAHSIHHCNTIQMFRTLGESF